jgi:redox-sensitive bicupin YhaK (pirin superfamily)
MLDEFSSDDPDDYIAGFPSHPHRGFETVTYMLDGHMLHEDHLGNRGDLLPGGAQWMTAGRGIIHSEMPQQESGRMRGFQLWINLPAAEKMKPAHYRDIRPDEIPTVALPAAASCAGDRRQHRGRRPRGRRSGAGLIDRAALYRRAPACGRPLCPARCRGAQCLRLCLRGKPGHRRSTIQRPLSAQDAGVLSIGRRVEIRAADGPARFLLLAARPLGEPVVQHGPFVMNSREEIEQAIADYRNNRLV